MFLRVNQFRNVHHWRIIVGLTSEERDSSEQLCLKALNWLLAALVVNIEVDLDFFSRSEASLLEPDGRRGRAFSNTKKTADLHLQVVCQVRSTMLRLGILIGKNTIRVGQESQNRRVSSQD